MPTEEALTSFHSTGLLKLEQVVPNDVLVRMVDKAWQLMERQGIKRNDPGSWAQIGDYFGIRGVQKLQGLRGVGGSPEHIPLVRETLDAVFGQQSRGRAANWGQALVTLPIEGDWLLPGNVWHFDHPCRQPGEISGVNVFLLMDDVEPGGGGTVVLNNSPQLMAVYLATNPKQGTLSVLNKGFLRFDPWLQALKCEPQARSQARNRKYMDADTVVCGIPVRIIELTGCAGDVFITHPALLHAPAMNVRERPRLMRTQRVRAVRPDGE